MNFTISTENPKYFSKKNEYNAFDGSGSNIIPKMSWSNFPKETKSFAISIYDIDAPTGSGFWHCILFNIPKNITELSSENISKFSTVKNDFGDLGYSGPCPPIGDNPHRYQITIYALDIENIDIDISTTNAVARYIIHQHILEIKCVEVLYSR